MSAPRLRPAIVLDAPVLADLATQLGYPSTAEEMEARLRGVLSREDEAVFVAEEEGDVIGWGHVGWRLLLESDPFAELLGLVVDARHRSRGVGARLVEEAERWAVARGLSTIRVRSNVIREDAHRFYLRSGYRLSKRQAVFTKDL